MVFADMDWTAINGLIGAITLLIVTVVIPYGITKLGELKLKLAAMEKSQDHAANKLETVDTKLTTVQKQTDGLAKALANNAEKAGYAAGAADAAARAPAITETIKDAVKEAINGGKQQGQ